MENKTKKKRNFFTEKYRTMRKKQQEYFVVASGKGNTNRRGTQTAEAVVG